MTRTLTAVLWALTPAVTCLLGCSSADAQLIGPGPGEGGGTSTSSATGTGTAGPCEGAQIPTDDARIYPEFAQEILDRHNAKRVAYCLEPLVWDCNLAQVAQSYAELGAGDLPHNDQRDAQYAALADCSSGCPALGENIYWHQPWDFFPLDTATDGWFDEEDPAACNQGGYHYTQMVWSETTAIGCGAWIDPADDKFHLVCDYLGFQTGGEPFPVENCTACN